MLKKFLLPLAISSSLMAADASDATDRAETKVLGCQDQGGFYRHSAPPSITGAFYINWERAQTFADSFPEDSRERVFLAPFEAIITRFTEAFRKAFLDNMPKEQSEERQKLFVVHDGVFKRDGEFSLVTLLKYGSPLDVRVHHTVKTLLENQASSDFIGSVFSSLKEKIGSGALSALTTSQTGELTPEQQQNLLQLKLSQLVAQSYFETTGEDYVQDVSPFFSVSGSGAGAGFLARACSAGFITARSTLAEYKTYGHLATIFAGKDIFVLGCGRLGVSVVPEVEPSYRLIKGVLVSSAYSCNHDHHVTLARSPGIYPDIVADINDANFLSALERLAPPLKMIVDEEGVLCADREVGSGARSILESLLVVGGKIVDRQGKVYFTKS